MLKIPRIQSLFLVLSTALMVVGPTTTVQADQAESIHANKTYQQLKKINSSLSHKLYDKQLDDTKTKSKKCPIDTNWFTFIKNVRYLKNNQLEIYVTESFEKLNQTTRNQVITHVQSFGLHTVDRFKKFDATTYLAGLSAKIYYEDQSIGHSVYLNNKIITWNN